MDQAKVKVIQDWPEPRKVKDVQSFLGFANFYRRFIFNYSDIVVPLTCLTRKGIPYQFTEKACEAFNILKEAFTTAPVLTHWIPDRPIVIETQYFTGPHRIQPEPVGTTWNHSDSKLDP